MALLKAFFYKACDLMLHSHSGFRQQGSNWSRCGCLCSTVIGQHGSLHVPEKGASTCNSWCGQSSCQAACRGQSWDVPDAAESP